MLTEAQKTLVRTYVLADPALSQLPHNSDSAFAIAAAMGEVASPAWIVWKTKVIADEIMQNGFNWAQVDNLSIGKARIWEWLFDNDERAMNPSKPNVRDGINSCWAGTEAMTAVRNAVYVHCKRSATIVEKLLSTGTGSDAVPATMTYEGAVSYSDISDAMGW